jgi:hypothetical protein
MLENLSAKLVVYASVTASQEERLTPVSAAVEKVAKLLKMGVEVVAFEKGFAPIYVYFQSREQDPIPIYCDGEKRFGVEEICSSIRNMLFVLSFHPKHSALKDLRDRIRQFS